jgi:TonB family protein
MDNLNKKDNIKKFNNIKQKGNILINEKNNKDQEGKKIKFGLKSAYDDNTKNLKYSDNNLKSAYDDNTKNLKYSDNNLKSAYDNNTKNLKYSDNNLKSVYDDNTKNLKYSNLDNNSDIKNASYSQSALSFDTSDFKHSYYAETIVKKISEQWKLVENYKQLSTIIYFKINRNGSIFNVSIKKSSGNKEYDRYALDAIHRIASFPNLPDDYKSNELGVYFEFKCRG